MKGQGIPPSTNASCFLGVARKTSVGFALFFSALSALGCHPAHPSESRVRPVVSAPHTAPSEISKKAPFAHRQEPVAKKETPTKNHLYLHAWNMEAGIRFHWMKNGDVYVSSGLAIGRLKGGTIEWDNALCSGLPWSWELSVTLEIEQIIGKDKPERLSLDMACAPPSIYGSPVPYEFAWRENRWLPVSDDERLYWRKDPKRLYGQRGAHYHRGDTFTWNREKHVLLVPDDPGVGIDGYLERSVLADTEGCLGRTVIVDETMHPLNDVVLPDDLCVEHVEGFDGALMIAGRNRRGEWILEKRADKKIARYRVPFGNRSCKLFGSYLDFDIEAEDRVSIDGTIHCADDDESPESPLRLRFDGHSFSAVDIPPTSDIPDTETDDSTARVLKTLATRSAFGSSDVRFEIVGNDLYEKQDGEWTKVTLSLSEKAQEDFLEDPVVPLFVLPNDDGSIFVLAGASTLGCMGFRETEPRILFSTEPPTGPAENLRHRSEICDLRLLSPSGCPLEADLAVLDIRAAKTAYSEDDVDNLVSRFKVPGGCDIVEVQTPSEHGLAAVPSAFAGESFASCKRFLKKWPHTRWCMDAEAFPSYESAVDDARTDTDETPSQWRWTVLEGPSLNR